MIRRVFAALLAATMVFAVATDAMAGSVFITSNGDVELDAVPLDGTPLPTPPLEDIKRFSGAGGQLYTNQVSGVAPFAVGAEIRTVGAVGVLSATNGFSTLTVFGDGDLMIVISAVRGTIVPGPGGAATALFTQGRLYVGKIDPDGPDGVANTGDEFDPLDPSTWASALIVAEYVLKPQETVLSGDPLGSNIMFAADQTNLSAVNTAGGQISQGQFLFREDSTDAQNALVIGASGNFGDDFISNVDDATAAAGVSLAKTDDALFSEIDQTLLLTDLAGTGLVLADLTVLNAFAAGAFTGAGVDLGGADPINAFASGLGGGFGTGFDPFPGGAPTGDFIATLGADTHIGHQAVPEPSSILLLSIGLGAFGFIRRRRTVA